MIFESTNVYVVLKAFLLIIFKAAKKETFTIVKTNKE